MRSGQAPRLPCTAERLACGSNCIRRKAEVHISQLPAQRHTVLIVCCMLSVRLHVCRVPPSCLSAASQRLALLCLGEIGRRTDLSSTPSVESAINSSLSSDNEDIKAAASLALGGVACGNLGKYLPALLSSIEAAGGQSKQQYLLLQALNEVVTTVGARRAGDKEAGLTSGECAGVRPSLPPHECSALFVRQLTAKKCYWHNGFVLGANVCCNLTKAWCC